MGQLNQQPHQGWTNYETWAVNAHLTNDEYLYEQFMAIVQNPDSTYQQAEALQEWLRLDRNAQEEDVTIHGSLVGMYTDLVCSALDNVNWREIVDSMWQDLNNERIRNRR